MEGIIIIILVVLYPHFKKGIDELINDLLFITKGLLLMLTIGVATIIRITIKFYERIKKHI